MKFRLKKDIVIKAGTIFDTAAEKVDRDSRCYSEVVIGLTKDTAGTLVYETGDEHQWRDPKTRRQLSRWFERIPENERWQDKAERENGF